jgi:hypothetical protein
MKIHFYLPLLAALFSGCCTGLNIDDKSHNFPGELPDESKEMLDRFSTSYTLLEFEGVRRISHRLVHEIEDPKSPIYLQIMDKYSVDVIPEINHEVPNNTLNYLKEPTGYPAFRGDLFVVRGLRLVDENFRGHFDIFISNNVLHFVSWYYYNSEKLLFDQFAVAVNLSEIPKYVKYYSFPMDDKGNKFIPFMTGSDPHLQQEQGL